MLNVLYHRIVLHGNSHLNGENFILRWKNSLAPKAGSFVYISFNIPRYSGFSFSIFHFSFSGRLIFCSTRIQTGMADKVMLLVYLLCITFVPSRPLTNRLAACVFFVQCAKVVGVIQNVLQTLIQSYKT